VLLVGLGRVGFGYDTTKSNTFLTHFKSIQTMSKFYNINLSCVEPSLEITSKVNQIHPGIQIFKDIEQVGLSKKRWNLIIIATPTKNTPYVLVDSIERLNYGRIVVEKPVAENLDDLLSLDNTIASSEHIRVGFPRRCLPSSLFLKKFIRSFGSKITWHCDLNFEGGVLNIGSHFLDLLEFIFNSKFEFTRFSPSRELLTFESVTLNENLILKANMISQSNNENSSFHIKGPVDIMYQRSGRTVECRINDSTLRISPESEIETMLLFEAMDYLNWSLLGATCTLPTIEDSVVTRLLKAGFHDQS
jgi:hypothetical protein